MDFFEHQAQAKAASNRLLLLFTVFCIFVVLCVNGVIYLCIGSANENQLAYPEASLSHFLQWQFSYAGFITSIVTLVVIGSGCVGRWLELRNGGNGLAVKLGGRSLGFASKDETEQKLINVVEEMAIAAGVTTPGIYVLDNETAINAFVVGYNFEDSALVVTHGLLTKMNRDELQAVVGHEFSHILHGDNRINIRLLILLGGVVWLSEIGKALTYDNTRRRHSLNRGGLFSSNDYHNSRGQGLLIGLPLLIIGYTGVFCGRLIRTAVSRKREYLADASSVQFTRNPEALASALNVIRENSGQGFLQNPRAEGIGHMCISSSQSNTWFATHPPLDHRIDAIDPTFLRRFAARAKKNKREEQVQQKQAQQTEIARGIYGADVSRLQHQGSEHLHDVIGTLNPENLVYAMSLHNDIPYEYRQALKDPEHARLMMLYLLLDKQEDVRKEQLAWIESQIKDANNYLNTLTLMSQGLQRRLMLPLVELLLPVLKTLKPELQQGLIEQVLIMAKWDGKLSMFEISLYTLLKQFVEDKSPRSSSHSIKKVNVVAHEINVIISSLIHLAGGSAVEKKALHERMINVFSMKAQNLIERDKIKPKNIYATLKKLRSLSPMLKRSLMDVCGDIVLDDGIIQGTEYETLRLISLIMGCPMPALPLKTEG